MSDVRSVFLYTLRMTENQQSSPREPFEPEPGFSDPEPRRKKPRTTPFSWKWIGSNGLILAFALVVGFFLWSFINRMFLDPPVEPEVVREGKAHTIQLDVLNGSGVSKIGLRFTEYLRSRGFDVVELGNYRESNVELTRVIDRSGNAAAAEQVAQALGIPKERVTQELDRTMYLDVSVIIGKDYRLLKPSTE